MTAKKAATKKAAAPKSTPMGDDRPVVPVKPGDVKLADMMHQNWACFAPSEFKKEDVENPKFWVFMAPKFKDLDTMRVTAEDGSWVAMAIIRRTQSMEVHVQCYDWIELAAPQVAKEIEINGYLIRHLGAVKKFTVHNMVNNTVVKEGFNTQIDAMKYITDHIQAA